MEITIVKLNEAKSRKAALNQCIYILDQLESRKSRRSNLMNQVEQINQKRNKLESKLTELESQIANLDRGKDNWEAKLQELKLQWSLTDSELLELRSSILRERIESIRKQEVEAQYRTNL